MKELFNRFINWLYICPECGDDRRKCGGPRSGIWHRSTEKPELESLPSTPPQVGDKIWSEYFLAYIIVTKVNSDTDWYFNLNGRELKAQTPLSYFRGYN